MKTKKKPRNLLTIGRADIIDLPDFNLENIKCKTDTGAYSCAIHTEKVEHIKVGDVQYIKAVIPDMDGQHKEFLFTNFKIKKVRNSFGQSHDRFVVKTKVRIFNKDFITDFSFSNRKNMKYPLLLGRKLMKNHFLVDVALTNLSFKQKALSQQ